MVAAGSEIHYSKFYVRARVHIGTFRIGKLLSTKSFITPIISWIVIRAVTQRSRRRVRDYRYEDDRAATVGTVISAGLAPEVHDVL